MNRPLKRGSPGTALAALLTLWLAAAVQRPAAAQGLQTGILIGTTRGPEAVLLPGVRVTVTSTAIQGERSVFSGANGDYVLHGLPPGVYRVVFRLEGMTPVERTATIELGRTARADAQLEVLPLTERIVVRDETPTALETVEGGANYSAAIVDALPVGRTMSEIAELAPGLTDNAPNANFGQLTISGGFAYDNVFLVDGVDINDNLFGSPNDAMTGETALFIEDAIVETQILTSAISAEYGRFTGGVVNAVTKSGGNQYEGSLRVDLSDPSWRDETTIEESLGKQRQGDRNEVYSATFGGPVLKDRFWFFLAGRDTRINDPSVFPVTGAPRPDETDNQRFEIKLTGSLKNRHTISATYTENDTSVVSPSLEFSIDPRTIDSGRLPGDLFALRYSGILSNHLFAELRYSEKNLRFEGFGGASTDLRDSPFATLTQEAAHYNAPWFDENDSETRDNEQFAASLSYLLTSNRAGSHDLKLGIERYTSIVAGASSQSPTEFVFLADYLTDAQGAAVFDPEGRLQPVFTPGATLAAQFVPVFSARTEIRTTSLYANDHWRFSDRWSLNLGLRYEEVSGRTETGLRHVDTDSLTPRLAVSYDPRGDGSYKLGASWAEYTGRHNETLFNSVTNRFPDLFVNLYLGPAGAGLDFDPGFDLGNYLTVFAGTSENVFNEDGLAAPVSEEMTLSFGARLGGKRGGYVEATYVGRSLNGVIEDFITFAEGQTVIELPVGPQPVDNIVHRNSDLARRDYQALEVQSRYHLSDRWQIQGHWTWQLENDGNFEGEGVNTPGTVSLIADYPEILVPERSFPRGRLDDFQRHKVRVWSALDLSFGRAGELGLGLLYRYDSAATYSLVAGAVPVTETQLARDPGYATPPLTQPVFFGRRGAEEFAGSQAVDSAARYSLPVGPSVELWVKLQVLNVFNTKRKIAWDTTVLPDLQGPVDTHGIWTHFVRGPNFGQARSPEDYLTPREFLLSLGLRF